MGIGGAPGAERSLRTPRLPPHRSPALFSFPSDALAFPAHHTGLFPVEACENKPLIKKRELFLLNVGFHYACVCVCACARFNTIFQLLKHVTSGLQFRPFSLFHPLKGRVKPQPCPSVRRARGRENTRRGVKIRAVTFRPGLSAGPRPAAPVRGRGRGVSPQAPRPGWPCTCPQGPVPPGEKETSKEGGHILPVLRMLPVLGIRSPFQEVASVNWVTLPRASSSQAICTKVISTSWPSAVARMGGGGAPEAPQVSVSRAATQETLRDKGRISALEVLRGRRGVRVLAGPDGQRLLWGGSSSA